MDSIIGLKILSLDSFSKIVSIIRKFEALSISDIKSRIASGDYVVTCDYVDGIGISKIIKCYKSLIAIDIPVSLFEDDEPCSLEFLENLQTMYEEISKEIQAEIDAELAEDN